MDKRLIESDRGSAKLNTILAIETVIDAIKHEDNRMYNEEDNRFESLKENIDRNNV